MKKFAASIGIVLCLVFLIVFLLINNTFYPHFNGWQWNLFTVLQRLLFGIIQLWIFIRVFHKTNLTGIIHLNGIKSGIKASWAIILYTVFWVITYLLIGARSFVKEPVWLVILHLFLGQIATAFWEELNFRAFVMEGYFQLEKPNRASRFKYAVVSAIIFGLAHAVSCDTWSMAIYRFAETGVWGIAFAAIYLYSHNILISMGMHFTTNVFFNAIQYISEWKDSQLLLFLDNYVRFVLLGIVFIVAILYIWREPPKQKNNNFEIGNITFAKQTYEV